MKKIPFFIFLISIFGYSQTTQIPDANFEQALINLGIDTNSTIDGVVPTVNISSVTHLTVWEWSIADLTGIEDFTALTYLDCQWNQLTSLDLSNNTALERLFCSNNQLTSLDLSNNTALTTLFCISNQLSSLDVSNTALNYLDCENNELRSLDVSNNTALTDLICFNNHLHSLDVSNNTALTKLHCFNNQLQILDVSNNTALTDLLCFSNQITSLDVSNNTTLHRLRCFNNQLTSLDVRNGNNTALTDFITTNNTDLTCILVDSAVWSTANWTDIDASSTFVNNETECSNLHVTDHSFEFALSVYPNPTDSYLNIEGNEKLLTISIYNLLGKKMIATKCTNKIDVQGLPSGVYLIRLSDGMRQTTKKFIKL
ncbi:MULTISPECIES: T9SS type A sorting domain-containing protein [unclassified Lacinutrix]